MVKITVAAQLAKLRKEREALEKKEKMLVAKTNEKVLAKIVALVKDAGLTVDEVVKALSGGKTKSTAPRAAKKSSLVGKKVAPKYRNPANPEQTWTGRGVAPGWAQALKTQGQLDSALIQH